MDEDLVNLVAKTIPSLSSIFMGVIPKNQIIHHVISKKHTHKAVIVNTDEYGQKGSHWVAIFSPQNTNTIFYFDSYGLNPSYDFHIMALIKSFGKKRLFHSNVALQSLDSSVCGLYCIYFLYIMSLNKHTYIQFINMFSKNVYLNDQNIRNVFHEIFVRLRKPIVY